MTASPSNPAPRPALRKATDSAVHPVAPERPAGAVGLPAAGDRRTTPAGRPAKAGRGGKDDKSGKESKDSKVGKASRSGKDDEKDVELVVTMPRALRRRLKAQAGEHGYTPEEAMVQLVRMWLDG